MNSTRIKGEFALKISVRKSRIQFSAIRDYSCPKEYILEI